ncbi:lactonase family protein [Kutzneria chonburiensis]|uniref:Lactonase family protein n=1 Tax=Kutzneria chonburiensis TaxID=1483604 RepID=A0ABV6MXY5_9PSEU|nr:beta-propeller fold lactonase family protein [Kutzneria chonburiensis]
MDVLFVQTNNLAGNQVLVCAIDDNGALELVSTLDTDGDGGAHDGLTFDPLDSQGSLVYDRRHRLLFAVNAGSNTVSVLGGTGPHPHLRQVVPSGGVLPVSLAQHNDLLYVLNAHAGGSITGYRIAGGRLHAVEDSTRSLELTPASGPGQNVVSPAQLVFSPDGSELVVATKAGGGGLLDVFAIGADGRPSAEFTANSAGTPAPFGFGFDGYGRLAVTDAALGVLTTYTLHHGKTRRVASQPDGKAAMCWIVRANGNFYVTDAGSNTISCYRIDEDGTPTVLNQTSTGAFPIDMAVTSDERFLYVQLAAEGKVFGYHVEDDATLTQVASLDVPASAQGIAVS